MLRRIGYLADWRSSIGRQKHNLVAVLSVGSMARSSAVAGFQDMRRSRFSQTAPRGHGVGLG